MRPRPQAIPVAIFALSGTCSALPPGFLDEQVGGGWNQAVGVTFAPADGGPASGRLFVWEKAGLIWTVENGAKSVAPLINLSEEVGDWRDHGMLGFAVDPNFSSNGYIYLLYVVDFHHAKYFGTPDYNPAINEYFRDTIGRVTRYTCNAADGFRSVDPGSRRVLIGESLSTGFPLTHQSHGVGTLLFATDGTLLVTCGDGASYETTDAGGPQSGSSNTALADGIITPKEDIGAFRSQLADSHSGKLLRIDPGTGDGVPSNPFYDSDNPRSPRSRVWALGLRNPFRIAIKPGSGSGDPADGQPGVITIGDVGWSGYEDLNVCDRPGMNFGWPLYEGMDLMIPYANVAPPNQDAPNPLFDGGACDQPYFNFRDLLVQDTLDPSPSFPNPCDSAQQIPPSVLKFVHRRPVLETDHVLTARVSYYVGQDSVLAVVGEPGSPCQGTSFGAESITGGAWYTAAEYPPEYRGTYFAADFARGWVKSFVFGTDNRPTLVQEFLPEGSSAAVCMAADPVSGDLHYIDYDAIGNAVVHRLRFVGDSNLPPVAVASAAPGFGPAPLSVQLTGDASTDPEGGALTYLWEFGDGRPRSTLANPVHVYDDDEDITAQGTFVARVDSLDPPGSQGSGNPNPDVMRDGVYPPTDENLPIYQWDSFHAGEQGNDDWIGYTFPAQRTLRGVVFQEGIHFWDGGWWDTIQLQYRRGGTWFTRASTVTPAYTGNDGTNFDMYEIRFNTPVLADGVRIRGNPGGENSFVSCGEFRVLAQPLSAGPVCKTATLTVTDDANYSDSATVDIAVNNSPPSVQVTSPVDGSTYPPFQSITVPLTAIVSDAEHTAAQLVCRWNVVLHHDDHTHPEPPDFNCSSSARLDPHGDLGDTFYYEISLTVTDPDCLSTTRTVFVYPSTCDADFNNDGFVTGDDFDAFVAAFEIGDLNADFNHDGFVTGDDFDQFVPTFEQGC